MGKKKHKHAHKKGKSSNKKKKLKQKLKFESRAEMILSAFPPEVLTMWYGDDEEEKKKFAYWMLQQETYYEDDYALDILRGDDEDYYDRKLKKLKTKKCGSITEILLRFDDIQRVEKQKKKGKKLKKKLRKKDLGIATYMNSSRYRKSFLNNDDYRKYLKKIAKTEKEEIKEMRKLGMIRSIDPDDELKKLLKANEAMGNALSDSYVQKHFIN